MTEQKYTMLIGYRVKSQVISYITTYKAEGLHKLTQDNKLERKRHTKDTSNLHFRTYLPAKSIPGICRLDLTRLKKEQKLNETSSKTNQSHIPSNRKCVVIKNVSSWSYQFLYHLPSN